MGIILDKIIERVPCHHTGSIGNFCKFCNAPRNLTGIGYQQGWVHVEKEVSYNCNHIGEVHHFCSKCGERLR